MGYKNYISYLMLAGATFFWSTNFILGKFLTEFPPLFLGMARFVVAALIFLPLMRRSKTKFPRGRILRTILLMGFTGIFIFNPLIYLGLHYTTSINATMLNSLTPLIVAVMSHFWLKEKLGKIKWLGLFLSILGILLIAGEGELGRLLRLQLNSGDLIILIADFAWATYTILIKLASKQLTPVMSTGLAVLAGLIFLIPAAGIQSVFFPVPHISPQVIVIFIYLGIFPSVISFFLWNTAVQRIGPSLSGIFNNLIPVFNVILATQILHETLHVYHITGFTLVVAGVLIAGGAFDRLNLKPFHTA